MSKALGFMKLEDVSPELIDQAVCDVVAIPDGASAARVSAICVKVAASAEAMEWVQMMDAALRAVPSEMRPSAIMTAFTVGLEVGYKLGCREILRYTPGKAS
jgi:hypothetical protein